MHGESPMMWYLYWLLKYMHQDKGRLDHDNTSSLLGSDSMGMVNNSCVQYRLVFLFNETCFSSDWTKFTLPEHWPLVYNGVDGACVADLEAARSNIDSVVIMQRQWTAMTTPRTVGEFNDAMWQLQSASAVTVLWSPPSWLMMMRMMTPMFQSVR